MPDELDPETLLFTSSDQMSISIENATFSETQGAASLLNSPSGSFSVHPTENGVQILNLVHTPSDSIENKFEVKTEEFSE